MRTANIHNQANSINEKRLNKPNAKNFSKSPLRRNQNSYNNNQYAVIEQAKRDFQKVGKSNYFSNTREPERNFSKENINSKNSKNSDYEISKDFDSEKKSYGINQINSFVKSKNENLQNLNLINNNIRKTNNNSKGQYSIFLLYIKFFKIFYKFFVIKT